jgi:hypothetical protein
MTSRVVLRLGAAARGSFKVQPVSRALHTPAWLNSGIRSRATGPPQLSGMMSRTASTIPDDFDVDVDVPAAAQVESVAPTPYLETLSLEDDPTGTDWSRSYHGLSVNPFSKDITDILLAPIDPMDIEIKPGLVQNCYTKCSLILSSDGMIYLPEIKYRRILNKAFGPGGWGLAPRGETNVSAKVVSREYALVCLGRCVFNCLNHWVLILSKDWLALHVENRSSLTPQE